MPTTPRTLPGEPFVFVGGLLVLDLLNTRPRPPAKATEFLRTTSDLAAWAEAAELPYAASLRAELRAAGHAVTLTDMRTLRERIREGLEGWQSGAIDSSLLEALNVALARGPRFLQLRRTPRGVAGVLMSDAGAVDRLFADVARSAAQLLLKRDPRRFKQCEGPTCSLVFYDESKPRTRRWCSMAFCGKDAKVNSLSARRHSDRAP